MPRYARIILASLLTFPLLFALGCDDDETTRPENIRYEPLPAGALAAERGAIQTLELVQTLSISVRDWARGFEEGAPKLSAPGAAQVLGDPVYADERWTWETTLLYQGGAMSGSLIGGFDVQFTKNDVPQREAEGADRVTGIVKWAFDLEQLADGNRFALQFETDATVDVGIVEFNAGNPDFTLSGGGDMAGSIGVDTDDESGEYAFEGSYVMAIILRGWDICPDGEVTVDVVSEGIAYRMEAQMFDSDELMHWVFRTGAEELDRGEIPLGCNPWYYGPE